MLLSGHSQLCSNSLIKNFEHQLCAKGALGAKLAIVLIVTLIK